MSIYAQIGDVRGKAPSLELSDRSRPSTVDVQRFLDEVEEEVNAVLQSRGYTVPFTGGPRTMRLLRSLVATGALAETLDAVVRGRGTDQDIGQTSTRKLYEARLGAILKGQLVLPDEEPTGPEPLEPEEILIRSNIPLLGDGDTDEEGNQIPTRFQRF